MGFVGNFPLLSHSGSFSFSFSCYAAAVFLSRSIFRRLSVVLERKKKKKTQSRRTRAKRFASFLLSTRAIVLVCAEKNERKKKERKEKHIAMKWHKSMFNEEMREIVYFSCIHIVVKCTHERCSIFRKRPKGRKINKSRYDQFMTALSA